MRVELQAPVLHGHLAGGQVERLEVRTAPGGMNDEIGGDAEIRLALALGVDQQTAPAALDPGNGGTGLDADAERLEPGRQPAHQVGIEVRQEPLGPL